MGESRLYWRLLLHAGLLQKVGVDGQNDVRMEATPVASLQTLEKQFMGQLQHKATETWNYPGDFTLTSDRGARPHLNMCRRWHHVAISNRGSLRQGL